MNDVESLIRRTAKIQYKVNANDKKPRTFGTQHKLYQSEIHFTNGAVTQVADKLLKKKLIEKYKKADNKKTVYFKLTKEGTVAYNNHEKFHAGFNEKLAAYLSSLSKKEFDAIARLAELVDNNITDLSTQEGLL